MTCNIVYVLAIVSYYTFAMNTVYFLSNDRLSFEAMTRSTMGDLLKRHRFSLDSKTPRIYISGHTENIHSGRVFHTGGSHNKSRIKVLLWA